MTRKEREEAGEWRTRMKLVCERLPIEVLFHYKAVCLFASMVDNGYRPKGNERATVTT